MENSQGFEDLSRREFLVLVGGSAAVLAGCSTPEAGSVPLGEITHASVTSLAEAIRRKQVSALEVVEAHLRRIEAVNPKLNAVVQLTGDAAREDARRADAELARGTPRGPLHGVPMTIKDSLDTAGVISTGGTKGRAAFRPAADATPVARLRAAGAILLGKTNTPELTLAFETDNLVYGRTNNPYDLARTPGGSSGGAAAIIAAAGSPFDLGSDTGGSIRLPSHFCGIAGIKPTSGRVPRTGHIIPADGLLQSLTQIGPMARYVDDLTLLLPIIAGPDGRDPYIAPAPLGDPRGVEVRRLRVAFYTDNGIATPEPAIIEVVRQATNHLKTLGCPLEEARPPGLADALQVMNSLWVADGGAWIKRLLQQAGTSEVYPHLTEQFATAKPLPSGQVTDLVEQLDRLRGTMLAFWQQHDVLVCPVNAKVALPHGGSWHPETFKAFSYTETYNAAGWPGAVVRGGTSPEGLPIGVQVVAPPWREDLALAVAKQLEGALGGWRPSPLLTRAVAHA